MNFSSSIVLADVGIPMIIIEWPLMLMALVPVIILEALLIRRWVPLSGKPRETPGNPGNPGQTPQFLFFFMPHSSPTDKLHEH